MSQTSGATVTMRYQRLSPISRLACVLVAIVGLAAAAITIITPLDLQSQAFFGLFTAVVFLVINRFRGRAATLCLMALSAVVSTRYLWWRTTETLGFSDPFDMVFGYGLYAAELYAWVVLIIGYFQVLWPLDRKPVPLPADMHNLHAAVVSRLKIMAGLHIAQIEAGDLHLALAGVE